jgi:hypothetical protein
MCCSRVSIPHAWRLIIVRSGGGDTIAANGDGGGDDRNGIMIVPWYRECCSRVSIPKLLGFASPGLATGLLRRRGVESRTAGRPSCSRVSFPNVNSDRIVRSGGGVAININNGGGGDDRSGNIIMLVSYRRSHAAATDSRRGGGGIAANGDGGSDDRNGIMIGTSRGLAGE